MLGRLINKQIVFIRNLDFSYVTNWMDYYEVPWKAATAKWY